MTPSQRDDALRSALRAARENEDRWIAMSPEVTAWVRRRWERGRGRDRCRSAEAKSFAISGAGRKGL